MFSKILIANRGEIAVRIIRACREMNIGTVAVYSEADRDALHVRMADEAYPIGPPPAQESYLRIDRIIEAARKSGAAAIHPGYGFLAENSHFAATCEDESIAFIGPTSRALQTMGDKTVARDMMARAGVPIIPGAELNGRDTAEAEQVARSAGYPIIIKAALGGGGKGMRIVSRPDDLPGAMKEASSEASSAFGDGRIFIEKYLQAPRHIEFQILADLHGHIVHLGERECSIQRRHQKIIEESPSAAIDGALRRNMGEAAVQAARVARYTNAGTVEFLLEPGGRFYFLEMNTRLQVEHPVTELVTRLDLVKEQIHIAAGKPLPYSQDAIASQGWAIECRIYAEDPEDHFYPSTGTIRYLAAPGGPGVRNDGSMYEGGQVSLYYDPLISKLIVWGRDRTEAIARMKRALREYIVVGIKTTISFCLRVMENDRFISGAFDTHFIAKEMGTTAEKDPDGADIAALAAALAAHQSRQAAVGERTPFSHVMNPWKMAGRKAGLHRE